MSTGCLCVVRVGRVGERKLLTFYPHVRIAQPQHWWHVGPDNPFSWGGRLVHCTRFAASLTSTHSVPGPFPPSCDEECLQTLPDDLWGTKLPAVENHLKSLPWTCITYAILMAFLKNKIYPKELKTYFRAKTCTQMFIAAFIHHCQNLDVLL